MKQRGRPPTPGLLTPREEEVLGLIRKGCSNRAIAEELGISLQGVKYHVTEILGKLGVESRDEAAAWEPNPSRRWGFAPLGVLSSWRESAAALVTSKVAAASLSLVMAAGLAAGIILAEGGDERATVIADLASVEPTPTEWPDPCDNLPQVREGDCISFRPGKREFATLEEAAQETSFVPLLPEYVPAGYERKSLVYSWPAEASGNGPSEMIRTFDQKGPGAPFEFLVAEYVSQRGDMLHVNQGYGVTHSGTYEDAPEHLRGKVTAGTRTIFWYRGYPEYEYTTNDQGIRTGKPVEGRWEDNDHVVVYWESYGPSKGAAWEIAPDGTKRVFENRGQPMDYVITSDTLPVDELLQVAASVP